MTKVHWHLLPAQPWCPYAAGASVMCKILAKQSTLTPQPHAVHDPSHAAREVSWEQKLQHYVCSHRNLEHLVQPASGPSSTNGLLVTFVMVTIIMPKSALKLQVGTQAFCTLTLFKCSNVGLIGTFLCNHPMATTPLDIQHKLEPFMASTPLRKSLLSPPPGVPPDCWNIKRGKIFTAPFSS